MWICGHHRERRRHHQSYRKSHGCIREFWVWLGRCRGGQRHSDRDLQWRHDQLNGRKFFRRHLCYGRRVGNSHHPARHHHHSELHEQCADGGGGLGIVAVAGSSGAGVLSGSATVNASGPIVADGSNAVGILADSGFIRNVFSSGGRVPTTTTGSVGVTASNVSTLGNFGTAISATGGGGGVTVNPSG